MECCALLWRCCLPRNVRQQVAIPRECYGRGQKRAKTEIGPDSPARRGLFIYWRDCLPPDDSPHAPRFRPAQTTRRTGAGRNPCLADAAYAVSVFVALSPARRGGH